ncbi:hypothetical protein HHI36_000282 [Cryptolaemus montrouzieri]|uniref:Uncharacterized protein n=1 Tax=Cryptolaemus montrouzieri TaxID=559131 RepID=A0ABD2P4N3_9CUCU
MIRAILNLRRNTSCKPHCAQVSVLTLPSLFIYEAALFICRNRDLFGKLTRDHQYNARKKNDLLCERFNYTYIKNKCSFLCSESLQPFTRAAKKLAPYENEICVE